MTELPGLDPLARFTGRREAAVVRGLLVRGERVLHAVQGRLGRREGLLAATDRRVVWAAASLLAPRSRSWPYTTLSRVEVVVESPSDSRIELAEAEGEGEEGEGETATFTAVDRRAGEAFAAAVQAATARRRFRAVKLVDDPADATDPETLLPPHERRLRQLDRMRAKGSITESEYQASRAPLLRQAGLPGDLPPPRRSKPAPKPPVPPWPDPDVRKRRR